MRLLKQSTAANVMVFMTDSSDHITGKASLTLTITSSQDGGAFGSITPTVTERGSGWYSLALTTSHTNTLGDLAVHITSSGADPSDLVCRVVAVDFADGVRYGLTAIPNVASGSAGAIPTTGIGANQISVSSGLVTLAGVTHTGAVIPTVTTLTNLPAITANWLTGTGTDATAVTKIQSGLATPTNITAASGVALAASQHVIVDSGTVTNLTNLPAITANWITAAGINAAALNGKGDWSTYAGTDTSGTTTLLARLTSTRSSLLDNLDAAISTRSTYAGGAVASVTGAVGSVTAAVTAGTVSDKTGYSLNLTQAIPTSNTAQTVGDALNAARADGFGKETIVGTTLTLYAGDGTTPVRVFTLDSASAPTSRT